METTNALINTDNGYIRKNYSGLDIGKFLAAVLIICAHFVSENCHFTAVVDATFSVYIISVPFFFTVSGFLFFDKLNRITEKKQYLISYIKRIVIMYLCWSAIYLPAMVYKWIINGELTLTTVLKYAYYLVVNTSYATIWFLPALVYSVILVYLLCKKLSPKATLLVTFVLFVIGTLGYSYSFVQNYLPFLEVFYKVLKLVFGTTRNGIFHGAFYVALGNYISTQKRPQKPLKEGFFAAVFAIGFSAEAIALKLLFNNVGADTIFLLIPFTYFALRFCLSLNLKERKIYIVMRKISLLMFVSQRLFLTAIPKFWPAFMTFFTANEWLGLFMMLALIISFSLLILFLSKRVKFLKYLMGG